MTLGEKFLRAAKQGKLDLKPDQAYKTFIINEGLKSPYHRNSIYATGPDLYAWSTMNFIGVNCDT